MVRGFGVFFYVREKVLFFAEDYLHYAGIGRYEDGVVGLVAASYPCAGEVAFIIKDAFLYEVVVDVPLLYDGAVGYAFIMAHP